MKPLHPFFSYFGSKYRLAKHYPKPVYKTIIEPFAGSAGYSLLYPDRDVVLYEIYEPIVNLWNWLIKVSEEEILALPTNDDGRFNKEYPIEKEVESIEARTLIGFWLTESQTNASRYPLSQQRGGNWTERKKKMLASQLQFIRHWKVEKLTFAEIPNCEATWYVDPPYEKAGKRYRFNEIDYSLLGHWCQERSGQVIVCEQDEAKWLAFKPLELPKRLVKKVVDGKKIQTEVEKKINNASNKTYKELIWHKNPLENKVIDIPVNEPLKECV